MSVDKTKNGNVINRCIEKKHYDCYRCSTCSDGYTGKHFFTIFSGYI